MENLLNLNQLSVISRDWTENGPKTDREWTENRPTRLRVLAKYAAMLLMLLTLGVGQMWADPWVKLDVSTGKQATKTVGDKLNGGSEWWYNYQTNGGWSSDTDIQVLIGTSSSSYSTVNASWYADSGSDKKVHADIGSFTFDKSGIWYAVGKYKSGSTTAYTSGTSFTNNTSLSTSMSTSNSPYWEVTPPTVKSFTVSTTGSDILSGTGTSSDPYIIAYNGSLVLTLSGSKNKTDANSSLQYYTNSTWNTTTSRTISGITSTTKTSVTVKMRCYNSTASLSGTESSKTIYYKSEASYNVTAAKTPSAGGSVTPTSATAMGTTSGGNITATPSTGYNFSSWAITSGSGYFGESGTATTSETANTKFRPSAATTVTATFTPKTYSITLDGNGGSDGSATATYNSSTLTSVTHCSRASYDLNGYYTATSGGTKVINANGTLVASVSTYTNSSSQWIKNADVELHAQWTYNPVTYSVTYAVGTGYTSYGSLSAANTSTSAAISSGSSLESGTGVTFTATPETGYVVEGWYTNAACTEGKHDAGSTTYSTTLSGNITVYVKFVEKTWSVAFAAGTGGTVTTPAATPQTVGQLTGINIAATPGTGYTFNTWTITSGSGSFTSSATTNSNKFKPTAASTITASFNETMSTLSTSCHYDAGNPSYAAPSVSGSATTVGYATTRTITATAAGTGYTFAGWTLTNCTRTDGGSATATSITIRSNGDGAAATVVANYNEDLSSPYTIKGGTNLTGNNWTTAYNLVKKTGHSTESVAYYTLNISSTNSGVSGSADDWSFKIINGSTWYGLTADGSYWWQSSTSANQTLSTSGQNIQICANVAGPYEIKVDYTTPASPKVTVTFPVSYTVNFSRNPTAAANAPTAHDNTADVDISTGANVLKGHSVTFTKKSANSGYTWYRWENGSGSNLGNENTYTTTISAATTVVAKYTENNYTVTVNAGAGGTVASGSVTGHKDTKVTLPTATPYPGYRFTGWTTTTGSVTYTNQSSASSAQVNGLTDAATVQANFTRTYAYLEGRMTVYNSSRNTKTHIGASSGAWADGSTNVKMDYDGTNHRFYRHTYMKPSELKAQQSSQDQWFYVKVSQADGSLSSPTAYHPSGSNGEISGAGYANKIAAPTTDATYNFKINSTLTTGYAIIYFDETYVWYELEHTLVYDGNGKTSGNVPASTTYYNNGETVTVLGNVAASPMVRTGYTFSKWNTKANGSGTDRTAGNTFSITENTTLYAQWTPKTSALTLDKQTSATGYYSAGTVSTSPGSATYGSAMPTLSGTMPVAAAGYKFMGFYSETGGNGTQYYDGSGNSVHNWDVNTTSGTTLYAYYKKAEITALTFDAASVEASGEVGVTPTIDPVPEPTVSVCWRVLYDNDNPLSPQPEISWDGTKATFTAPAASGTYKVEAKLYNSGSCGSGTLLSTRVQSFTVAGIHTVTVQYKCGEDEIKASTTTTGRPFDWSDAMTAPDIFGYTFSNWTAGTGVTLTDDNGTTTKTTTTNATIKIKATYNGTLTANYTQKSIIYFKNTLGWSDVYVNFYTASDWDSSDNGSGSQKGAGNNGVTNRNKHMTQIGSTDVWYYDYGYNDGGSSITPSLYVSFTSASQNNVNEFWAANPGIGVVYPANYPDAISTDKSSENGFKAATPMFVPLATQDAVAINVGGGGRANYYNAGYWTKYLPGTGYTLEIYNSGGSYLKSAEFTSGDELMPMKAVVDLEAGQTYKYILRRGGTGDAGINYGNSGTMTYSNHGQGTAWEMINTMSPSFTKCGITTNTAGNYTFNLSYAANASTEYRLRMEVDYPVATGDYRVIYKHTGQANYKASAIVQKVNNGKDTVSFFIKPGSSPSMKIQRATVSAGGVVSWSDYSTISSSVSGLAKDSVYNICLTMNGSGAISVENVEVYTGNFYIRTDAANSKWDNYRSDPDHLMTFSEYSITHGGYSHYYCHWVQAGTNRKNVKFCIANDYSPSISDTLARETAEGTWANIASFISEGGDILRNANVRFTWNQHDNTISRAYVDGAQENGSRFLVISSTDGKIKKADGSALSNNEVTFSDNENWIYEANVKAQPKAAYKLISTWGEGTVITQYFKGGPSSTETLIDGSGSTWYDIRLLYDFKTNRLVAAWVPSDATITSNNAINADVMFIREHQGDIAQLTFNASGQISAIKTAYGVLKFNKWTLANKEKTGGHSPLAKPASVYERSLFWISFPFRVKLSEVFGFGTYGTHWAIQRYDGAKRAEIGHFAENGSFWRWMSRNTEYLEPNQGYLLAIDLDLLGESSDVWGPESRSEQIELYFPSYGDMPNISNASVAQTIPSHECTINRATGVAPLLDTGDPRTSYNRTIFDSHWNVLSVPTYVNTTAVSYANTTWTAAIGPKFLYTWNASDNTITATTASGYTYHAMHSYMVQYAGNLTWTASSGSPASIVARKTYAETPKEVEFRLELQQNEQEIDRTFVVLSNDEEVSADFQFGEDMTKEFNAKKSAIYTFIADEAVAAGNTLPMSEQTTVVPVGVDIKADGDYTFAMPNGTSGVGVVLIDNETGIRTSLSALDYTVFLEAGTYDKRFMMEISPIKQGTTDIDLINGDASANGVRKLLIDQKMYIIKGDKMYDATGRRVE